MNGSVTQKNAGKNIRKPTNAAIEIKVSTQYLAVEGFVDSVMINFLRRGKYKRKRYNSSFFNEPGRFYCLSEAQPSGKEKNIPERS